MRRLASASSVVGIVLIVITIVFTAARLAATGIAATRIAARVAAAREAARFLLMALVSLTFFSSLVAFLSRAYAAGTSDVACSHGGKNNEEQDNKL